MMTMDISMYGQHDQPHASSYHHTTTDSVYHPYYNTNDAGTGYGQTAPSYHQSVGYHETYHHHHDGYGTQILYDGSGTSPPPDTHFYSQGSLGQLGLHLESPTDPIISTDNGLSYTNLDYNNGGTGINNGPNGALYPHPGYDQSPAYMRSPIDDSKGYPHETEVAFQAIDFNQHHQQQQQQQQQPHLHHTPHQQHHISHQQVYAKQECQQRLAQPHGQQPHEQPQTVASGTPHNSHSVTTYRWMQVKRNVPKPAGSYLKNASTLLVIERNVCSSVGNFKPNLFSSNPPRVWYTC
ncbi:homeotic protein labial-like [Ctenocephalides felis]|uniref:homeotic protein labial-like n=1 Tax=Ctenocephalides felis TaxID=7515 RepID=UPI000E6E1567|nr:homeotic protein labial-like [Ctenocephalides felis]